MIQDRNSTIIEREFKFLQSRIQDIYTTQYKVNELKKQLTIEQRHLEHLKSQRLETMEKIAWLSMQNPHDYNHEELAKNPDLATGALKSI